MITSDWQTISIKGQLENILGFEGHLHVPLSLLLLNLKNVKNILSLRVGLRPYNAGLLTPGP
jgi:hypothetical protein